jgi:iron complex outermembrane receptor protein
VGLEEVVVTAQRREERLQDAPLAVTAYSTRALEARGVTNLSQLGQFTPGLVLQQTTRGGGGGSATAAFIRGVGTGDYNLPTDPAIGVYIDGVYLARSVGGLMSLPDVQQIEVLKGPQGTLWGRNTLGGTINIVTTRPHLSGPVEGLISARVGSYGRKDLSVGLNGPIVDGRVGGKLSVSTVNSDGWGRSEQTGLRLNNQNRFIARGALRFEATDDLSLTLDADYSQQNARAPVISSGAFLPPSGLINLYNTLVAIPMNSALGLPPGSTYGPGFVTSNKFHSFAQGRLVDDFKSGGVSATLDWAPSAALQVKAITAVRSLQAAIDQDGDTTPYPAVAQHTLLRDVQLSQEVQVSGKLLGDRLTYLAGVYAFTEIGHSSDLTQVFDGLYEATGNKALALSTDTFQRMEATSYAIFTQETYALLPNLRITAGARLNYDQKDYDAFVLSPQLHSVAIPDQAKSPHWDSFTPKLGIDWNPTEQVLLYASYSQGFKSGGISPPLIGVPPAAYAPETIKSYEIGAKTEWFDRRLTANFAAYYSDYRDIQLTTLIQLPNGGIGRPVQNGGNAHIYGGEAEIVANPVEGLTLNLSAAYTNDRLTSVSPGVAAAVGAFVGERLPNIPDYSINVGAQYVRPTAFGDLTIRGDFTQIGKAQLSIGDPASYRGAYPLLNARIAFAPKSHPGLEVAIEGTNLTDEVYLTYSQTVTASSQRLQSPGPPRMVFVTAKYKF